MKYIDSDGYVGIIYAYGAGVKYATKRFGDETRSMVLQRIFDYSLVDAIFNMDMSGANKILREKFSYVKISAYDLQIDWIPEGTKVSVIIDNMDRERVVTINEVYTV